MSDCTAAVRTTSDGTLFQVHVATGSDDASFPAGYDQWRQCVEVAVTAPPERGKANRELLELTAAFFDVGPGDVTLAYGHTSRKKGVLIRRPKDFVIQRLNNGL